MEAFYYLIKANLSDDYFSFAGALIPSNPGPTITPTIAKSATESTPTKIAVGAGVPVNDAIVVIMKISKTSMEITSLPN